MVSLKQPNTLSSGSNVFCRKPPHDGFLWRHNPASGNLGTHPRISRRGPLAPFDHRLRVQAIVRGQGTGCFFATFGGRFEYVASCGRCREE